VLEEEVARLTKAFGSGDVGRPSHW
jgi:hypothetical protein